MDLKIFSWGLLTTHIFSKAIPDHFLTKLSIFLLRVACSGHSEAKKSGNQNDKKSSRPINNLLRTAANYNRRLDACFAQNINTFQ